MKRIVVLIDGTWNREGTADDTNVAILDGANRIVTLRFIRDQDASGIEQNVHYHDGVGTEGDFFKKLLGGAIGLGLKQIILQCYGLIVDDYEPGDEIYLFGFSRGSYAARALAGLIGASGIARRRAPELLDAAWQHYRVKPTARDQPQTGSTSEQTAVADYASLAARQSFHADRSIACVGVWDTVGSYGIPAGFGLAALARYYALITLGFHDTSFGDNVAVGLHALGVDEHRRPFVPTFWTIAKGQRPNGYVEQTWFAGAHCNVGGGYPDSGLSDQALIWMIARAQALTGLEFNVNAIGAAVRPNIGGAVVDSTIGWPLDHVLPHYRKVLPPDAICHGYLLSSDNPAEERINERVHWSVLAKRQNQQEAAYRPANLPVDIPLEKVAEITGEERALLDSVH
ncbi:MAG TPA: DUF2235 domain-containing protein [Xanthobacteraceae bacterium]|jgi:hypothetical protein